MLHDWSIGYLVLDTWGGVSIRHVPPLDPAVVRAYHERRKEQMQKDYPGILIVPDHVVRWAVTEWIKAQPEHDIERATSVGFYYKGQRGVFRRGVLQPPT